jgi:hypothetical protein
MLKRVDIAWISQCAAVSFKVLVVKGLLKNNYFTVLAVLTDAL